MKKISKILCTLLSLLLITTTSVACHHDDPVDKVDDTKLNLTVNFFYGGLGDEWMKTYATEFENLYKDTDFGNGKKGVNIILEHSSGSGIETAKNIAATNTDIIFCEYLEHRVLANAGIALDISDIIDKPLTEFGEDATIASKMPKDKLDYYKAFDGNVYALPYFDYLMGVIYDLDTFEGKHSKGHGFYFAENGGFTTGLEGAPAKAAGPDGKKGTYDDGLPVTHDEFFEMMDEMVASGVVPFTFPGNTNDLDALFKNLYVNDEGAAAAIKYSYDGKMNNLVALDENGKIIRNEDGSVKLMDETQITNENGHLVFQSASKLHAYEFAERFAEDSNYYKGDKTEMDPFDGSHSNVDAEEDFLYGALDSKAHVAMQVTGIWWESEARDMFESMTEYGDEYSRKNRRTAWMPMPYYQVNEGEERRQAVENLAETSIFINKNIPAEKVDIAKEFLRFISTDKMLLSFTEKTSATRGLQISNPKIVEESKELTCYGRSILNFKDNADIILENSANKFSWIIDAGMGMHFCRSTIDGTFYEAIGRTFKENKDITAEDYFYGNIAGKQKDFEGYLKEYNSRT